MFDAGNFALETTEQQVEESIGGPRSFIIVLW
jgi:hypothetical protein